MPQTAIVARSAGSTSIAPVNGPAVALGATQDRIAVTTIGTTGPQGAKGDAGSETLEYVAGEALSGQVAVTLNAAGEAVRASAFAASHAHAVIGVTTGAAVLGDTVNVMPKGYLYSAGWSLTAGGAVFLGASGALTQTAPVGSSFLKILGIAVSTDAVALDPQPAVFLA